MVGAATTKEGDFMISISRTASVNPPEREVTLTRADVWRGLEAKTYNALPFIPAMTECDVVSRTGNVIERQIEYKGLRFGERITFEPEHRLTSVRTSGSVLGTIRNEILTDDAGELQLRFAFDLELAGVEAGSTEEKDYEATMKDDYLAAVDTTLAAIRRWVREGSPVSGAVA
jgi:hypothetical protein